MQQSLRMFDKLILADLIMYLVIADDRVRVRRSVPQICLIGILPTLV
jgi:hypothetical protein